MSVIQVKAKPRSKVSELKPLGDGAFLATLNAPPVDGKANAELIALVARYFGVTRGAVSIKSGAGARLKRVQVDR